ncbi:hypothetical protein [Fischerella thermalis]|uniref:hypothetical protein n=1 Tax=Fischerella thermalis TaxID=372787 RepID=UPI0011AFAAE3|nr:hypothetical protein [Fischerella thermalis]
MLSSFSNRRSQLFTVSGDYRYVERYLAAIAKVTPQEIQELQKFTSVLVKICFSRPFFSSFCPCVQIQ